MLATVTWEHNDGGLIHKKPLLPFIFLPYYHQFIQQINTRGNL